jgi:hypothetical protein
MGLVVDQAHLADVVAGLQRGQNHLAPALVGRDDAHPPGEDDEQRVGLLALLDNHLAALEAALDHRFATDSACAAVSSANSGTRRISSRLDNIDILKSLRVAQT